MAPQPSASGSLLSLLDRLIDLDPESRKEPSLPLWEEVRELKQALCRDLSALLNTRRAEDDFSPDFEQARQSVLTFGIADFTSLNLKGAADQEALRRSIEEAVRRFEPRLTKVAVAMEPIDPARPALRFELSAVLRTDLGGEPAAFDLTLHRDTRRFGVSGALV